MTSAPSHWPVHSWFMVMGCVCIWPTKTPQSPRHRLFCQHPVSPDLAGLPNLGDLPHLVLSFYLVVGGLLWMVGYCGWWVTVDGPSLPPTLLLKKELSCWCRAPCCLCDVTQAWCNVCEILAWNWPTDCLPGLQSRWCEKTPYNFPDCSILYKKFFRVVSLQTMI